MQCEIGDPNNLSIDLDIYREEQLHRDSVLIVVSKGLRSSRAEKSGHHLSQTMANLIGNGNPARIPPQRPT